LPVVPATVGGIVVLVLLVLPGLAFELIRQRRRAGRDDSPFVEASRVLVAGLSLGAITEALLAFVSLVGPGSIVSLSGLFTTEHWVTDHLLVSGWTAWAYGLVSVTLAALAAAVLPGMNPGGHNHPESGWVTAFDRLPRLIREAQQLPATPVARLSVRLTDGTVYVGDRAEFSVGSAPEGRELLLGGELLSRPPGAARAEPTAEWHRILLRENQISDILVQYVVDGRIVIGEAKSNSTLRGDKGTEDVAKGLAYVAQLLSADEIVLATSRTRWAKGVVSTVRHAVSKSWIRGPQPVIQELTKVGS